jgi:hypothetical protein
MRGKAWKRSEQAPENDEDDGKYPVVVVVALLQDLHDFAFVHEALRQQCAVCMDLLPAVAASSKELSICLSVEKHDALRSFLGLNRRGGGSPISLLLGDPSSEENSAPSAALACSMAWPFSGKGCSRRALGKATISVC